MAILDHNLMPIPFYAFKTVYVAWDIENCAVPRGLPARTVLARIRRSLRNQGYQGDIRILAVAANQDRVPQHIQDVLLNNGVEYYDLHTNAKQASDDEIVKRIREKMGCTDRGNFMLISGDGGFEGVVRELETEGHNTILAYNLESAAEAIQYKVGYTHFLWWDLLRWF
ncbi:meiosis regulator and mRNA stability factor 1-like [Brassica napus]|uniref:meiosis regulator and mRNA stability factor 1-like n=1 Tax=Brassica napus TaxID=3708 RepID=UPI00207862FD|nr:meiosis regulator and mRNA stability factor 1-like [Brassica napus]